MLSVVKNTRESAIGRGIYDATEAVRLINFQRNDNLLDKSSPNRKIGTPTIRRWLQGYNKKSKFIPPLWKPDYINDGSEIEVSFRDLIELRFIKSFKDAGVSFQTIRVCFQNAMDIVGSDRPFSNPKFRTDGKTIFERITEGVHEGAMTDLKTRQTVFKKMFDPSLKDLEFEGDELVRWWPLGQSSKLVVDPAKAFGRPVILGYGVTAEALANAVKVEGSIEAVAHLYEVPTSVVSDSIDFHERLAA
jgi:uncharacterized protein (DUF433 family)